jgi:Glycine zipper
MTRAKVVVSAAWLGILAALPIPPAQAQEALGGAIGGAILGGVVGGAVSGRPSGAATGAVIGGATGAIIGAQAEQRHRAYYESADDDADYYDAGYYWWHGHCYYRDSDGAYAPVPRRYCY